MVKNLLTSAGDVRDTGSIPGPGRCLGGGHGNPLQYSCLQNPRDRGAWWATVHRVTESDTTERTHVESLSRSLVAMLSDVVLTVLTVDPVSGMVHLGTGVRALGPPPMLPTPGIT